MSTISMTKLTELLKEHGQKAEYLMSGGGVGTIYIGEFDEEGNAEYAIGPSDYYANEGESAELCWGRDGDDGIYYQGTEQDFTEEKIASAVINYIKGESK